MKKDETRVDWTGRTGDIINFIRGFSPFPAAFTRVSEGKMKLYFAVPANADSPAPPGTVLGADERGLLVKTGDGALSITELQAPGGKRMSATEYLRGHDIPNGTVFE
ncbi:hypothetical protein LJC34_03865 [Oscillospiraceae bacterium OttesenSCG-928-G22]|nr:hypothetical protein [Oscillospiraceae bacterium OttesenSCG-928-G22]